MAMQYQERPDPEDESRPASGLTAEESSALDAILARIRAGKHVSDLSALTDMERNRLEFVLYLRNYRGAFTEGIEE